MHLITRPGIVICLITLFGKAFAKQPVNDVGKIDQVHFPKVVEVTPFKARANVLSNKVSLTKIKTGLYYLSAYIEFQENTDITGLDLQVQISEPEEKIIDEIKQKFHWLPQIKSGPDQVAGQHVFRSPCIIHVLRESSIALIPDLNMLAKNLSAAPYYLDLQYADRSIILHYGIAKTNVDGHVYYKKSGEALHLKGPLQMGFYLLVNQRKDPLAMLKAVNNFLWENTAAAYTHSIFPQTVSFEHYADTGYTMALKHYWVDLNDSTGGITLSTFKKKDGTTGGRFFENDLWYQSWFNNMRTAYGLYSWGRQARNQDWKEKAWKAAKLLMAAPNDHGWFKTIYAPQQNEWIASGGNKGIEVYYTPDNCWAAYWLMRFSNELKAIPCGDEWLLNLGDAILKLQNEDGSFPARVRVSDLQVDSVLNHTASSAMATWYLEELLLAHKVPDTKEKAYRQAVSRSLEFLTTHVLPGQRFEDFESYFSCSPKPMFYYDTATALYNQNTLSMQWCAEAFLKGYQFFRNKKFLDQGEYCLNILSLYQQVWNPPFISLYTFGGFGVQNTDGEWNDARQAQFAETFLNYYKATGNKQYLERAVYACRASFALMTLPENKEVCPNNYNGSAYTGLWPGTMAENYAHHGEDRVSGQSGFHWGTGSALTTAAIFKKELGDLYVDTKNKLAIGVNGLVVDTVLWNKTPEVKITRLKEMEDAKILVRSDTAIRLNGKNIGEENN